MTNYLKKFANNDRLESKFDTYRQKNSDHKANLEELVPIYKLMSMSKTVWVVE